MGVRGVESETAAAGADGAWRRGHFASGAVRDAESPGFPPIPSDGKRNGPHHGTGGLTSRNEMAPHPHFVFSGVTGPQTWRICWIAGESETKWRFSSASLGKLCADAPRIACAPGRTRSISGRSLDHHHGRGPDQKCLTFTFSFLRPRGWWGAFRPPRRPLATSVIVPRIYHSAGESVLARNVSFSFFCRRALTRSTRCPRARFPGTLFPFSLQAMTHSAYIQCL